MWQAFKLLGWKVKIGIILLILATYAGTFYAGHQIGYTKGVSISKVEIAKYETKVKTLEGELKTAQGKTNEKIVVQYVDRVKTVEKTVYVNRNIITETVPQQFNLSVGWVYAHNQAVRGLPIDPVLAAQEDPATVTDVQALLTVSDNYGACIARGEQIEALRAWAKSLKTNIDEVNKNAK